jgi:hypothetical protein
MNKTLSIDAASSQELQSANFNTTKNLDVPFLDESRPKLSSLSTLRKGVERRLETEDRPIGSEFDYCI